MTRRAYVVRAAALLSGGAYAVHQLRYQLGSPEPAEALHHHGHGYLVMAVPLLSLLLAAGIGQLLWSAMRPAAADARRRPFSRVWASSSACLLAVYTVQELLEGAIAPDHPDGLVGVFGSGGWAAVPLALLVGAIVALLLRCANAIDRAAPPTVARAARLAPLAPLACAEVVSAALRPSPAPLALNLAGRAPPTAP